MTENDLKVFWDLLIELVEDGKVVPILGPELLTLPEDRGDRLLYPYLARKLGSYLGNISTDNLPEGNELNEVACRYLTAIRDEGPKAANKSLEDIYGALKQISAELETIPIPEPLLQLAKIQPLRLFVTTTFDPLLRRALDAVRRVPTKTYAYAGSRNPQDLPADILGKTVVYHLLGKVSATPMYAVTQEDVLEFFHTLQSPLYQPSQLFDNLDQHNLLILGSSYNGWLARFFMRMSKRERLMKVDQTGYMADSTVIADKDLVVFLRHFSKSTKIFELGGAVKFVGDLYERWADSHGPDDPPPPAPPPAGGDSSRAPVFLSYAHEDKNAVEQIMKGLKSEEIDVFLDTSDVQGGDEWKGKLRRSVRDCSLFLPVISQHTLTPERRFFRQEWNWAIDEAQMASFRNKNGFLLPVVIDDTPVQKADVPDLFESIQWENLPGGQTTPQFVDKVKRLYREYHFQRTRTGPA